MEILPLRQQDLTNAKLYANREIMLRNLEIPQKGIIGEVGVALGYFSEFLIKTFNPASFVAFATYDLHKMEVLWGKPTKEIFRDESHLKYYRGRFEKYNSLKIEQGLSYDCLAAYPDKYFDMLYIDADHQYDSVKRDADLAKRKIKNDGVIVFNDYIMYDHLIGIKYGIIPAVNDLVVREGWKIKAFAFQRDMFCDIAIARH